MPRAMELHVVGGPADVEVVASSGEFPDEMGQRLVVGVAAGFCPQDRDGIARDLLPFIKEVVRAR